jgi:hypothetical protein
MFSYTPEIIAKLKSSISKERISTYEQAVSGDTPAALELYIWNTEISSAFYVPLQGLEVTLRNSLHRHLSKKFSRPDWYDALTLDPKDQQEIEQAKIKVRSMHGRTDPPHMVAELSFGFWLSLLTKKYHGILWIPVLHKAFPNARLKCTQVHSSLDHLRILRNRIAHHEPIFPRHLANDYASIIKVLDWMCPETAKWIDSHNVVNSMLSKRLHAINPVVSDQGKENTSAVTQDISR